MSIKAMLSVWYWYLVITYCLNVAIVIWVTVGGLFDLKYFFKVLKEEKVDDTDDGRVTEKYSNDARTNGAVEQESVKEQV